MSGVPMRYREDPAARMQDRLARNGDCLEWTGSRNEHGYGMLRVGGRLIRAHRYAYELEHGPIPPGMDVLHACDNPPCCAGAHLSLGDAAENASQMVERGRHGHTTCPDTIPRGERHGGARLAGADVSAIRNNTTDTVSALARHYGVARSTIRAVRSGQTWRHL